MEDIIREIRKYKHNTSQHGCNESSAQRKSGLQMSTLERKISPNLALQLKEQEKVK